MATVFEHFNREGPPMDSQVVDGVRFTMDTAERYTFEQARAMLHRDMGRKWGAYALFHAGIEGECVVGGTKVTRVGDLMAERHGALFTITEA